MSNVKNGFEQPKGFDGDNAIRLDNSLPVQNIEYTITPGASNVCDAQIKLLNGHGEIVESPVMIDIWLSDSLDGSGLTATNASGTVQAKSASGQDVGIYTAKKALKVQTKADGTYTLEITDTAKTGFYVCCQLPLSGLPVVSAQLQTADYGA